MKPESITMSEVRNPQGEPEKYKAFMKRFPEAYNIGLVTIYVTISLPTSKETLVAVSDAFAYRIPTSPSMEYVALSHFE